MYKEKETPTENNAVTSVIFTGYSNDCQSP